MLSKSLIMVLIAIFLCQETELTKIESNFYSEEACSQKGGFCVLADECPGPIANEIKPLCKGQSSNGAVCCPHLNQTEVNCFQLHNDCRETCPDTLDVGRKGCPQNTVCCILV